MKVLIATQQTQGSQRGDYAWTLDGELVTVGSIECANADQCGCARGFCGLGTSRATTTAIVADLPLMTDADVRGAVRDWLERDGWVELMEDDPQTLDDVIDDYVADIYNVCRWFPVGTVVRRDGGSVFAAQRRAA